MTLPTVVNLALEKLNEAHEALRKVLPAARASGRDLESATRKANDVHNLLARIEQLLKVDLMQDPDVQRQEELRQLDHGKAGRGIDKDRVEEFHESYGVITQGRISGTVRLAGTALEDVPNFIECKVYPALRQIDTRLHTEHFRHSRNLPLLTFPFSMAQWLEHITNNGGLEIPCTLTYINGVEMRPVPEEARTPLEQIVHDAKKAVSADSILREYQILLNEFEEAIEIAKSPNQTTKRDFQGFINKLRDAVTAPKKAAEWATERLAEDAAKVAAQTKLEIAAAFETVRRRTGVTELPAPREVVELTQGDKEP